MEEVWKPVVGYEGLYEVSNLGRVKSLTRTVRYMSSGKEVKRTYPEKIRAFGTRGPMGYLFLPLWKEGKDEQWYVHTLVLTAFVGPRPDGMECLRRDGDHTNNRVENLRWGTASRNRLDSVRHGTHVNARKTHCKRGHEFSLENTHISPSGARVCRTCDRLRYRKRR